MSIRSSTVHVDPSRELDATCDLMKRFGFGSDIHSENVCRKRNEKLGKLNQALPARLDGCLHGGDEVPHLEIVQAVSGTEMSVNDISPI